jgi:hypothetical protein
MNALISLLLYGDAVSVTAGTTEASLGPPRCVAGVGASVQVTGAGGGPSLASGSRLRRDERMLVSWRSGLSR